MGDLMPERIAPEAEPHRREPRGERRFARRPAPQVRPVTREEVRVPVVEERSGGEAHARR